MTNNKKKKAPKPSRKRPPDTKLSDLQPILNLHTGKPSRTEQLPDLDVVYLAVFDAYAITRCASKALDEYDGEEDDLAARSALHAGVEALRKTLAQLQEASAQLSRFQRAGGARDGRSQ